MAGLQVWVWLLCAMCMSCNSDKDELSKLWAVAVDHHQSSRVEAAIVVSPALLHYLTSPSLIGLTQGYQAVIDAYPGLVKPAYSNAAALLLQQASYEDAYILLSQALLYFKQDASILANAAIAASQTSERAYWQKGLALGLEALQLEPSRLQTHHVVGNLYQQLGDLEAAQQHFVRASMVVPTTRMVEFWNTTAVVNRLHLQGYTATVLAKANPWAIVIEDFVTPAEAASMVELGQSRLTESFTYATSSTSDTPALPPRISETAWLGTSENSLLQDLKTRVLAALGLSPEQLLHEELQMVRYGGGGYYHPHLDSTLWHPRDITVLYFLNSAASGTVFSNLSVDASPLLHPCAMPDDQSATMAMVSHVQGRAVVFRNTLDNGAPDPSSYHGGCFVPLGDEKLLANHWFTLHEAVTAA